VADVAADVQGSAPPRHDARQHDHDEHDDDQHHDHTTISPSLRQRISRPEECDTAT